MIPEQVFTATRIASEPATLATLASYAGRNFETELAVPTAPQMLGLKARSVTVVSSRLSREV